MFSIEYRYSELILRKTRKQKTYVIVTLSIKLCIRANHYMRENVMLDILYFIYVHACICVIQ